MHYFITGTDTEVGKTFVSLGLINAFHRAGYTTKAMKPIASGAYQEQGNSYNSDARALQLAASKKFTYNDVNPFLFQAAIAPHIAAKQENKPIDIAMLKDKLAAFLTLHNDAIGLIEGAGGWHLPIDDQQLLSRVIANLKMPVILVVGMRLGCLNHALLTAAAIQQSHCPLVGWVANCIDPDMPVQEENSQFLQANIAAPCLGVIPWQANAADYLDIALLLS